MIDKKELEDLKTLLIKHCYKMGILRSNSEYKKKKAAIDILIISVINTFLSIKDLKECINDVEKDKVINLGTM